jgi:Cupin-like domain
MKHFAACELPRLPLDRWRTVAEKARAEGTPAIIAGAFSESTAVQNWKPATFAERFGDERIRVLVDLPADHSPYLDSNESHSAEVTIRELVDRIEAGERIYLNHVGLDQFGDMKRDIDLSLIATPPIHSINLWLGGPTHSGLHFDPDDNFLVQIFGQKRAILVAPQYARSLHLIRDTPFKSGLSPEQIEGPANGSFGTVPRWRGTIAPGDALFIPKGWWHYLASVDRSISLNVWHGGHVGFQYYGALFFRSGPSVWMRVARDFAWCGLLRRPYLQRLYCPAPLGVQLYQRVLRFRRP